MCGIYLYFDNNKKIIDIENHINNINKIKNRGPDNVVIHNLPYSLIAFHRLSIINDNLNGNQPFFHINKKTGNQNYLICNGEIFNYNQLKKKYFFSHNLKSDCEILLLLYNEFHFNKFCDIIENEVLGEFAFCIIEYDKNNNLIRILSARDHLGIRPLFYSKNVFSSNLKSIKDFENVKQYPPGLIRLFNIENNKIIEKDVSKNIFLEKSIVTYDDIYLYNIRNSLINAVKIRLNIDLDKIGFLLSGGLDSSLICAISALLTKKKIKTFSIGIKNESTDLQNAELVAKHINSEHTVVYISEKEIIEIIDKVIDCIESYDITTVRASIGNFLIAKYIKENTNIKVVISGEVSDELTSGYLFNWFCPQNKINETTFEYLKNIHYYDGLRCDRTISEHGLEARIPFSDIKFIKEYLRIPQFKRHPHYGNIEKYFLRQAFYGINLLPDEILFRRKEAFSDGVSSKENSLFKIIQNYCNEKYKNINHDEVSNEAYYYKQIFIEKFGYNNICIIPGYWKHKYTKNGLLKKYHDPSARTL